MSTRGCILLHSIIRRHGGDLHFAETWNSSLDAALAEISHSGRLHRRLQSAAPFDCSVCCKRTCFFANCVTVVRKNGEWLRGGRDLLALHPQMQSLLKDYPDAAELVRYPICTSRQCQHTFFKRKDITSSLTDAAKEMLGKSCQWCGRVFKTTHWCDNCQAARYCSRQCQQSDWTGHRRVCGKNTGQALSSGLEPDEKRSDSMKVHGQAFLTAAISKLCAQELPQPSQQVTAKPVEKQDPTTKTVAQLTATQRRSQRRKKAKKRTKETDRTVTKTNAT